MKAHPKSQRTWTIIRKDQNMAAIAEALVKISDSNLAIARAIHRLGTADAATDQGAIEVLSGSVGRVADALDFLAMGRERPRSGG
jgi:hypothetical protein